MSKRQTNQESFMLVYDDWQDPSEEQTAHVLQHLAPFEVEEILPGTIRVVGEAADIEQAAGDMEHWRLTTEKHLSDDPPHRKLVR